MAFSRQKTIKFPFYKQLDLVDCGPSCLRMIAKHYGKSYTLESLRDKCFIRKTGVTVAGVSDGAQAIGFRTKAVKVTFQKMENDAPLPCIAYWRQRHFVVVYQITETTVYVADPAQGLLTYTKAEFLDGWQQNAADEETPGILLLLEPAQEFYANEDNTNKDKTLKFSYFWNYLRPYKRYLYQIAVGMVLGALLQFIFPFMTQAIVDRGIEYQDVKFINLILFAQLALFLGLTISNFLQNWISIYISSHINIALISDFLAKLMRLPISFFETRAPGDILQRIGDHHLIENFLTSSSLSVIFSLFNMIVFSILLGFYNLSIFTVFWVSTIIYFGWMFLFLKKRKQYNLRRFDRMSDNQNSLIELVTGMNEIKLQNVENQKRWQWEHVQARLFKINLADLRLNQYQEIGAFFISQLKDIFITYLAAKAVIDGQMTLGTMLSVQSIVGQVNAPLNKLLGFIHQAQDAKISLDRLAEIHQKDDEDAPDKQSISRFSTWRDITFQDMTFSYGGPSTPAVLKNINLTLVEGQVTAIVGASGSGKTTLLKLLLKFYNPTSGNISIGTQRLENMHTSWWRGQCGVVMQDGFIFSDTIQQNIVGNDETIDENKLNYAIFAANLYDILERLPMGLATKIGQEGMGLSVGQKQRILIARAIYKNPPFLFFDEATSALDANNEKIIMGNLQDVYKGRTVVVIAHRLSTVRNADTIIVLDKGEVVEQGSHNELVAKRGYYYNLVKNQLELGS